MTTNPSFLILIVLLGLPTISYAGQSTHVDYNNCILESMKGVSSDVAARIITQTCQDKFPDKQKAQPLSRELNSTELSRLTGRAGKSSWGEYFSGSIYNGNCGLTISKISVVINTVFDQKDVSRTYSTQVYINPQTTGNFSFSIIEGDPEAKYSWGLVAARGIYSIADEQLCKQDEELHATSGVSGRANAATWVAETSEKLINAIPDKEYRDDFLNTLYYESARTGLDPGMVLGLIKTISKFRKYYVSEGGGRGYMGVHPEWVENVGDPEHNLFHLKTNLRYGCTILRHELDKNNGDLYLALGEYVKDNKLKFSGSVFQLEVWAYWKNLGGRN